MPKFSMQLHGTAHAVQKRMEWILVSVLFKPWLCFRVYTVYKVLPWVVTNELWAQYFSCWGRTSFSLRTELYRNRLRYLFRVLVSLVLYISLISLQFSWFWLLLCISAFHLCNHSYSFPFKRWVKSEVANNYFLWIYWMFL